MEGASSSYYSFDPVTTPEIDFITAYGSSQTFGYHAGKSSSSLTLVANN